MQTYTLSYNDQSYTFDEQATFIEAASVCAPDLAGEVVAARLNGKLCEAGSHIRKDGTVTFISKYDPIGHKIYTRTALYLMCKCVCDMIGTASMANFQIHFTIANGYYCEIDQTELDIIAFTQELKERMRQLVRDDLPIHKTSLKSDDAKELFMNLGMPDKAAILHYRTSSYANIYQLEGYSDYHYGYMAASTGVIDLFDIIPYQSGFVITMPTRRAPHQLKPFVAADKLFNSLYLKTKWERKMNAHQISDLNAMISSGEINDMILVQEALQDKKIAEIASAIIASGKRIILIAGPSSSGKTTFSHRLSIQLRAEGYKSYPLPVDDYFVNRVDTPLDEDGKLNYETLKAIDTELLNQHLTDLLEGKCVELPTYNFITGEREYKGRRLQMGPEDILVIEGIHALNDEMTYAINVSEKFKIYISALTTLNIDNHNRVSTTDGRLLRRIVRDAATRGASAQKTIAMWNSVGRGEEENIFPYQENADIMFNSALVYELPAIKQYAIALLYSVPMDSPEYDEAKRLIKFLSYFLSIDDRMIPRNSIIREFIGNSCFEV